MTVAPAASMTAEMPEASALATSPTYTIIPARTTMASPAAMGASTSPLTMVPILRMNRSLMRGWTFDSPETVLPDDLRDLQTPDPGQGPSAVRHGHGDDQLVVVGRIDDAELDSVEVAPHECRVLIVHRNVEGGARTAALLRRRDDGLPTATRSSKGRAELGMEHGGDVLELALGPHDAALAVAVDRPAVELGDGDAGKRPRELHALIYKFPQILDVATGEGVAEHRGSDDSPHRRIDGPPQFEPDLFDGRDDLPDVRMPSLLAKVRALGPAVRGGG